VCLSEELGNCCFVVSVVSQPLKKMFDFEWFIWHPKTESNDYLKHKILLQIIKVSTPFFKYFKFEFEFELNHVLFFSFFNAPASEGFSV